MEVSENGILSLFVHLGGMPPKHLILNIERFEKLFPDQEAILVLSNGIDVSGNFRTPIVNIGEEDFPELLEMAQAQNFEFRGGFWKNTFLRLFAIKSLQERHPGRAILHIESDVLLMPEFPWHELAKETKLSWMRVHNGADIAALVFSPGLSHIEDLVKELEAYSKEDPHITDMSALFRYATEKPENVSYLPSLTELSCDDKSISSKFSVSAQRFNNGYFDPLGIGIWMFGQDPKNNYGLIKRYVYQSHHDLDPRALGISMNASGVLTDMEGHKIYSLHIHSKNLKLFGANWQKNMSKQIKESRNLRNSSIFVLQKFFDSLRDRSLISHVWIALSKFEALQRFKKKKFLSKSIAGTKKVLRIQ